MSEYDGELYDISLDRFVAAARDAGTDGAPLDVEAWADQEGVAVDDTTWPMAEKAWKEGRAKYDEEYRLGTSIVNPQTDRLRQPVIRWHTDGPGDDWANAVTGDGHTHVRVVLVASTPPRIDVWELDDRNGEPVKLMRSFATSGDAVTYYRLDPS